MHFPKALQKTHKSFQLLYYLSLGALLILWLLPLFILLYTSLQTMDNIKIGRYWAWPGHLAIENYMLIFSQSPLLQRLFNSGWISILSVLGTVSLSTIAGFAIEKYTFKFRRLIFLIFLTGNFIPFQILMIPVRDLFIRYHLFNTHAAVILFNIAFQTGFGILFMKQYIKHIPNALIEAARIDGANELQIFFYIILPACKKAITSLGLLIFIFVWGDVFWPLVLLQSDKLKTVTLSFGDFTGEFSNQWNLICAAETVACLPPLILFLKSQNILIQSIGGEGRKNQ